MSFNNVNKILKYLSNNPNSTIIEISNNTDIPRDTTKRVISGLKDDDIIIKNSTEDNYSLSNIFYQISNNKNNRTYFGIKILDQHLETIYYLFNRIKTIWQDATGKIPTKTQIYKLLVIINNRLGLELPLVWYKYGQIPPVIFNNEENYLDYIKVVDSSVLNKDKDIKKIISENIHFTSKELEKSQHLENELYKLKDKLLKKVYSLDLDYIIDNLDEFLDLTIYDSELSKYKDDFYSFIYNYYKLSDENKEKIEIKDIFIQVFNNMWDIIAITNFREDIRNYYIKNNMNLGNVNLYFAPELSVLKDKLTGLMDNFYDMFAITDFYNDEETQRLLEKVSENNIKNYKTNNRWNIYEIWLECISNHDLNIYGLLKNNWEKALKGLKF